jgi:phthalate 4,5-dioxygenase reductase subunit
MSLPTPDSALRPVRVHHKQMLTDTIALFELRAVDGADLPAFSAGAHLPVQTPSGAMRQYSLCGAPHDRTCYRLAIQREAQGRGGSRSMVDTVQVGDTLHVGEPINAFTLTDKAKRFLFVAGGIGITPILSMMHSLQEEGLREFSLLYLTRSAETTAFLPELTSGDWNGRIQIHHSQSKGRLDLWSVFEKPQAGTHVYCCGPNGLMDEVADMTGHWPSGTVHFERFAADVKPHAEDKAFSVHLQRSGQVVPVGAQQTILEALRQHGVHVSSSCESGTCGSCKLRYLEGAVDHRDMVLLEEEKPSCVMVCVSRAQGERLVLDL